MYVEYNEEQIKEIAENLDCGRRVFVHKENGSLLTIPEENESYLLDSEERADEKQLLDNNYLDYFEIEWSTSDAFRIMEDFTDHLDTNQQLQTQLRQAISRKRPFSNFKYAIDSAGPYRDQWFDFKNKKQDEHVENQLNTFLKS